jgi:hypothetical protein
LAEVSREAGNIVMGLGQDAKITTIEEMMRAFRAKTAIAAAAMKKELDV